MIHSSDLRAKFLRFFEMKQHAVISSASLVPDNDPTVLFTTAGMHPLVPYLLGAKHPAGVRLCDVQKCLRTGDIDDVGDPSHHTFFEMLGNWSLGDYFKKEAITWSWEFLTAKEWLGLDPDKLAFTVFAGDEDAPRDMESYELWRSMGVPAERIFFLPKEYNWWGPAGLTGPCGPDTEMFLITETPACGPDCTPACSCGHYLEFWNNVFMEYNKTAEGTFEPLAQKNVDTGMGLERITCVLNGVKSTYDTDIFENILAKIEDLSGGKYGSDAETTKAMRIVADHIRTATFVLGDDKGITPSNVDQGYVLRRLIRRAVRMGMRLGMGEGFTATIAEVIIAQYQSVYSELGRNAAFIVEQLRLEETRFQKTLQQGLKEFERAYQKLRQSGGKTLDGLIAFHLYDTFGFPIEMTAELCAERGIGVDMDGFEACFKQHQQTSSAGAEQRFKGGLADTAEETARLHTATHLLHAALRSLLDPSIQQRGSNITAERMRFDFNFGRKVEDDELRKLEEWVNTAIAADAEVQKEEMTVEAAKEKGAIGIFSDKYGDRVSVYTVPGFSMEICGGPHAARTGELGRFVIQKEQASSAGVRRIRAVLE